MIELRWLIDPRSDAHRVLQFRTQVMRIGYGYTIPKHTEVVHQYERPMGMTWTEWQDVPEANSDIGEGS